MRRKRTCGRALVAFGATTMVAMAMNYTWIASSDGNWYGWEYQIRWYSIGGGYPNDGGDNATITAKPHGQYMGRYIELGQSETIGRLTINTVNDNVSGPDYVTFRAEGSEENVLTVDYGSIDATYEDVEVLYTAHFRQLTN